MVTEMYTIWYYSATRSCVCTDKTLLLMLDVETLFAVSVVFNVCYMYN